MYKNIAGGDRMITYGQIMKYHNQLPWIYNIKTVPHENVILLNEIDANDRVLDLGCGNGWVEKQVLLPNGFTGEYVGYDIELENPDFKAYDNWKELRVSEKQFDVVIALNFIEHLEMNELVELLEDLVLNLMKPQSKMIILTPNVFCFDYLFKDQQHKTFWPYDALFGLLKALGFDDVQLWRCKGYHPLRRNPQLNEMQIRVCQALFLDWYGNILAVGKRGSSSASM